MKLIIAPQKMGRFKHPAVFLAGSIEMGKAEKWQDKVIAALDQYNVTIYNPRRKHWREDINNAGFKKQVIWELEALTQSDYILLYFDPKSKSPISLLELGLFARSHKIFCCCSKTFWRYGNVAFVCKQFKIPLVDNLDKLINLIEKQLCS